MLQRGIGKDRGSLTSLLSQYWTYPQTSRLVAVVISFLELGSVLEFLLGRKLEEFIPNGKLAVDRFLGETKVDDVEEAYVSMTFELLSQAFDVYNCAHRFFELHQTASVPRPSCRQACRTGTSRVWPGLPSPLSSNTLSALGVKRFAV